MNLDEETKIDQDLHYFCHKVRQALEWARIDALDRPKGNGNVLLVVDILTDLEAALVERILEPPSEALQAKRTEIHGAAAEARRRLKEREGQ